MRLGTWHIVPLLLALFTAGCAERAPAPSSPDARTPAASQSRFSQQGKASFYARMHHGQRTASGELHDQNAMVAAHRSLPFGTRIRVTNLRNNKQVTVRINDRGPFVRGRIIDLSRAAAERIGMIDQGVARVRIETLE
ncbi:septal ring lytic transglycosylase RlpA family protein [Stutzerimonas nitrititolerans]|uniref:septal ring lytic transglycosylase RlpA family protein n=1 Tax=Stutzerimonas nitrititolerans TaxID=2482751 RepID=UPI002897FC3C|nr:septal ring lytic transglycosylase RlpA family protein [Stutzerimonas nitrititolerans]